MTSANNTTVSPSWAYHDRLGLFSRLALRTKFPQINTVYLAGPMRGIPEYNFPAFHAAAKDLRKIGYRVMNPAEFDLGEGFNPAGPFTSEDLKRVVRRDLSHLIECDAIFLLPSWCTSVGATAEAAVARWLGIPVLAYVEEPASCTSSI